MPGARGGDIIAGELCSASRGYRWELSGISRGGSRLCSRSGILSRCAAVAGAAGAVQEAEKQPIAGRGEPGREKVQPGADGARKSRFSPCPRVDGSWDGRKPRGIAGNVAESPRKRCGGGICPGSHGSREKPLFRQICPDPGRGAHLYFYCYIEISI